MIRAERVNQPPSEFVEILILPNSALDRVYGSFITILAKKILVGVLLTRSARLKNLEMMDFQRKKTFFLNFCGTVRRRRTVP